MKKEVLLRVIVNAEEKHNILDACHVHATAGHITMQWRTSSTSELCSVYVPKSSPYLPPEKADYPVPKYNKAEEAVKVLCTSII